MKDVKLNWLVWLFYFIIFEVAVYFCLSYLLSGMGTSNQYQPDNTIVPNWVKAALFILLYILCLLLVIMFISNFIPSKHRGQLMRWVYFALVGMVFMLFLLFN